MVWGVLEEPYRLMRNPKTALCQIQALICSVFAVASFLWTIFIGANAYLNVRHNSKVRCLISPAKQTVGIDTALWAAL